MESLIKQMRVKFSGVGQGNKEETGIIITTDRRIPPQKTQSFKGERRKTQNWFRRQYSGEMNGDYESNISGEYACAVAAAAYAIKSLEDSVSTDQKRMTEHPETSSIRLKSKKDDGTTMPKPGSESKLFSGEASIKRSEGSESIPISVASDKEMPEKAVGPAPSIKKTPTFADKHLNNSPNSKTTEKTVGPSQPIKKTSTFADNDKPLNRTRSKKPERATSKPDVPPTIQPPFPPTRRQKSSTRPGIGETKADAWERAELAKIEKRYEKMKSTIQSWESDKKAKAKRQKDRTESVLERKRAKALQRHRSEMENISQIAGGARNQAEEKRRNEELKVKEKANKIRQTGKLPATCFCF